MHSVYVDPKTHETEHESFIAFPFFFILFSSAEKVSAVAVAVAVAVYCTHKSDPNMHMFSVASSSRIYSVRYTLERCFFFIYCFIVRRLEGRNV